MASATFRLGQSSALGGTYTYGSYDSAIDVTPNYYVKIQLQSNVGVNSIAVTLPTADPVTIAAGLPTVTVDSSTKTATFRMPNTYGCCINVKVVINGGVDTNGVTQSAYTKELQVNTLTAENIRLLAVGETDQYSRAYGHTGKINDALSVLSGAKERRTDMSADLLWYKCDDIDTLALANSGSGGVFNLGLVNTDYALGAPDLFGNSVSLFDDGSAGLFASARTTTKVPTGTACSIWAIVRRFQYPVTTFESKRIWGFGRDTDGYPWFEIWEDANGLPVVAATLVGATVIDTSAPTYAKMWEGNINMIAATYNGTILRLYWNGREVASTISVGTIDFTDATSRWGFGGPYAGTDVGMQGNYLDVGCAARVMTATEIALMYRKLVSDAPL